MFQTVQLMFETQYRELALAVDLIAERIRSLGDPAPGVYRKFTGLSSVADDHARPDATKMTRRLVNGQKTIARTARSVLSVVESAHAQTHRRLAQPTPPGLEKTVWMVRSLLAQHARERP